MATVGWTLCVMIHVQERNGFIMALIRVIPVSAGKDTWDGVPIMEPLSTSETLTVILETTCSVTTRVVTCLSHTLTVMDTLLAQGGTKRWGSAVAVDVNYSSATSTGTVNLTCCATTVGVVGSGSPTLRSAATSRMPPSGTGT